MPPVLAVVAAVASVASVVAPIVGGAILGISAATFTTIALGASIGASLLGKSKAPANSPENANRLRANIDVRTPRKTVIGGTALATDIRDEEFTGDQTYFHRFIVCASHAVQSIERIYFDDKLAWTLAGGVQGEFAGWLDVTPVLEGSAANAINVSSRMGAGRRYTGCAYVYLRYRLKDEKSPFAQSITTRITVIGKAAKLYDPRRDSTVSGGSGTHRADNQSTWTWDDNACRNPALALLFYLLGWRINGQLAVGKGIPQSRIDLESFAIAANICDETVATVDGTEPRYRCNGVWSEGDDPSNVIEMLKACMNADLDDVDGKLRLTIFKDDTFASDADFTADDVIGSFEWEPFRPLDQSFNIVRGSFTDPSPASLYQQVDYPQIEVASPDGIDRIQTINLPMVESVTQAQRLAALRLKREAFGGVFRAEFQATAWRVQKNSIVRLSFPPLGFVNKVFRVAEIDLRVDGIVPLTLREEDPSIYVAPALSYGITPVDSTPYDPSKSPIIEALGAATAIVYIYQRAASAPALPSVDATYTFDPAGVTGLNNGWSATIPAGSNPLYVSAATASYNGGTDIITPAEWSSPVVLAQDGSPGSPGSPGTNGLNSATVTLYARTATNSAPTVTTAGSATYTFATGAITGQPSGWTTGVPASGGGFLWIIRATAAATTSTDTIANTEWSSPVLMVQNGSDGNGATNAIVYIYRRSATTPALPTATATYTFATGALTGLNNSWAATIPAGSDPLYVAAATASSTGSTDTIAASEWSSPVILARDGTPGASGLNSATVTLHQRTLTSSAPSVATTGSATYTFATGAVTGQPSGWSLAVPSSGGGYLWVIRATAASTAATDTIANTEWSTPVLLAQDGAPGAAGPAATSAYLTNEVAQVFAYADGTVVSYGPATGEFKVFAGSTDVSSNFTLSVVSNPQTLTVSFTGRVYSVTGGFDAGEDTATVTIRATGSGSYAGVTFDKVFALAKAKGGYEIVSTLPITNLFEGRIVFLKTDDKLYRYTGSAWTKAVDGADIQANSILTNSIGAGQITAAQLASTELITLSAQIGTAVITGAKIGNLEVNTLKIANNAVNAVVTSYGGAGTVSDTLDVDFGSVSLSTIGGIVRIDISFDSYRSSGSTSVNLTAQIVRVVGTTETVIEQRKGASSASFPPTSFFITDSPGAGSVSYKARFSVDGGSGSFAVSSVAFAATEIKR